MLIVIITDEVINVKIDRNFDLAYIQATIDIKISTKTINPKTSWYWPNNGFVYTTVSIV